jgi:hypothetical protein
VSSHGINKGFIIAKKYLEKKSLMKNNIIELVTLEQCVEICENLSLLAF